MPVGACVVIDDDGLDDGGGKTVADVGTGAAGADKGGMVGGGACVGCLFVGRQEVDGVGVPELKGRVAKSSRRAVDLAFSYPVPQLGY
jgi:hypothetical protein